MRHPLGRGGAKMQASPREGRAGKGSMKYKQTRRRRCGCCGAGGSPHEHRFLGDGSCAHTDCDQMLPLWIIAKAQAIKRATVWLHKLKNYLVKPPPPQLQPEERRAVVISETLESLTLAERFKTKKVIDVKFTVPTNK